MMARYGISPRGLGDVGRDLFRELLAARLDVKARAASTTDKEEAQRLKVQAAGLKIVINSVYGQFNNGYSPLYDPEAVLAVTTTGQLLLIDLVERLDAVGAEILSVNTDGLYSGSAGMTLGGARPWQTGRPRPGWPWRPSRSAACWYRRQIIMPHAPIGEW